MEMSKFVRLSKTLADRGILIKPEEVNNHIQNPEIDHYVSTYFYDENHYKHFQATGSVKGLQGQKTQKVWWDFDSESDIKLARKDAITLVKRLSEFIETPKLEIYFSGNKGYNVVLNTTKELNRKQVEAIALKFAKDLKTFDTSLYDENQILRIPGTKHQKSGNYKIPLTFEELENLPKTKIIEKAKLPTTPKEASPVKYLVDIDDSWLEIKEVEKETAKAALDEFDINSKPRGWKNSKWALAQGYFGGGERDTAMMILASTYKGMGYTKIQTYYFCKSALKQSWERNGQGDFTKEDLWAKIERIFSEEWKGGTYSEKEDIFLQKKAEELGIKELTTTTSVDIKGALRMFKGYAKNIDELTLKTGLVELDKKQRITVGMSWGIIAGPGSGKTSLALQILHSMSKAGHLSIFFSYDMFGPHVVQKIIQTHWNGDDIEEVFERYKAGDAEYVQKVEELIDKEYPNVEFCFESGQSLDDARNTIRDAEQKRGQKCKFVVFDYNELIITDVSDPTQSSNKVAQGIRALSASEQICSLSLFQPSKMTGDPSTEITSYRSAKGGSGIEQSVSLMFGMSRPGFDPRNPEQDKYVSLNCVKNRMGSIFALDLYWDGYRGLVRSLKQNESNELKALRKALEDEEADDEAW